ncbi:alpha/beta fold hydrolase, partial [Oleiphilus sp. HI0080]
FYQRGTFKGWDDDCLHSYIRHGMRASEKGGFELKCPPRIESAIFASYTSAIWTSLSALQIPADMLYGNKTYEFVRNTLPKLEKNYDLVSVHEVEGGHCFMQERPEEFAEHILSLLQDAQ